MQLDPKNEDAWLYYGLEQASLGNYEKAAYALEKGLNSDNEHSFHWDDLSSCYIALGRYEDALKAKERAIKLNGHPYGFAERAGILILLERDKKVEKVIEEARISGWDMDEFYSNAIGVLEWKSKENALQFYDQ